ncbi:MAG: hypothetical protein L0H03_17710, partial [Rhodococcus sp. (in: high G+C Gram-positive bacteria)]|nr:hypothetical protein [Rhodococcus sp. (in: high G+C Gram-positive bacteria)]
HLEDDERWDQIGALLADAAQGVERAGADFLLLCTTTFHKDADQVEKAVEIGVVDEIVEPTRTRSAIATALAEAPARRGDHGNIPL